MKWTLITGGAAMLLYVGLVFYAIMSFSSAFDADHSTEELIDNYEKRQTQILELKSYFNSIVPRDKQIEIEFGSNKKLFRFGISPIDTATGDIVYPIFLEWDLKTNSERVDSVIKTIGWTQQTIKELKQKLDQADCIQIESGEPTKIGWQRSGMGMYSYNVFDKPIRDSQKSRYNDNCTYILYNDKLVLEYGGGAIGSQCFPRIK
ncbi:MAG: hypothetical protein JWQ27_390 [Ferruginibacter sp.]|nr:hypothetical protein [Ferruginibacter sp.]